MLISPHLIFAVKIKQNNMKNLLLTYSLWFTDNNELIIRIYFNKEEIKTLFELKTIELFFFVSWDLTDIWRWEIHMGMTWHEQTYETTNQIRM